MRAHVGILGGGQLAMYLCAAARRLGLTSTVIAHNADAPAAYTADTVLRGDLEDLDMVASLVADVDVVTFDIEEIPPSTLKFLASQAHAGRVCVHPAPATLLVLQDKLLQKQWLVRNGLPTLPFRSLEKGVDIASAGAWFGLPFVQKARRGGYDGRGVQIVRSADPGTHLWTVASIIEPCLEGVRELAVIGARTEAGDVQCYEVAELAFSSELNVLESVVAPAQLSNAQRDTAIAIAGRALSRLEGAGVFAVELFLCDDGTLLVNEISPRVHNSGHHTLESCETSQFEQHVRAITGLPLGSARQPRPAVMLNLLYNDAIAGRFPAGASSASSPTGNAFVHWYGKTGARPKRKVGHITTLADETGVAQALAGSVMSDLETDRQVAESTP